MTVIGHGVLKREKQVVFNLFPCHGRFGFPSRSRFDEDIMTDIAGETIILNETGKGPFQVEAKAGSATFLMDEPVAAGGMGSGPNPYDLLSAAIGACSLMTVRLYASRKKWPLERVQVKVTHHRGNLNDKDRFVREIQLTGQLDDAQRARLREIAMHCPVSITMERGSDIETILLPPEASLGVPTNRCEHARDMHEACEE
jgi:putative redox protein